MEIKDNSIINMDKYGKPAKGEVRCIHVKIKNIKSRANDMIVNISDTSWINNLGVIEKISYQARSEKTINKLVNNIFNKVDNIITAEFGEYLVSISAHDALIEFNNHVDVPLSELWKEKISGNPGFDFHTESENSFIVFGEAKYSSRGNPHMAAITQILKFIDEKKDLMELVDLKNFVSRIALENAEKNKRSYAAAFSINGECYKRIFDEPLIFEKIEKLLSFPELYIIGVEI